jgi:YfiH family protein
MKNNLQFIPAHWPAPKNVRAITTIRAGGLSVGAYESFNLGDHVGDDPESVRRNRALLRGALKLSSEPVWMKQVHGVNVVNAAQANAGVTADGAWTDRHGIVCAVLTADCLPVFLCDKNGTKVALLHAGWRGLAAGVIEAGVQALAMPGDELLAYLGPAIGPGSYEVGDEVREAFEHQSPAAAMAFLPRGSGRWLADLYELAEWRLRALGVTKITFDDRCTCRERDSFFSYRRDGVCGRMASLTWIE